MIGVKRQTQAQGHQGHGNKPQEDGHPNVPPPEGREELGLGKLVAYNDHRQGRIQLGQIVYRGQDHLGQGDAAEVQYHSHHYADDAGIEQKGLGRCLYPTPGHLHQAIGPGADREHGDIGGAVENTDGAQESRLQGVAHKAAVGENYAEAQGGGPFGFLPQEKLGYGDAQQVDQQRQQKSHAKIMKHILFKAALKGHHHHARGHHIHHQLAGIPAELVADHFRLAQHKTDAGQYK